jgi:predicted ATPase
VAGAAQVQRVLAAFVDQGVRVNLGFYTGLLAELEAETLGAESALPRIDEAFRLSERVEHGCSLSFLHRLRGQILLKHVPANPALAEEAFRTSIAVAKEQAARSPVLLASLALAKVLQSTGRPIEAHTILAAALEGFSPTPEMSEIAEAQALLAALAEIDEVKDAIAQRERRLHLQTAYGQAVMYSIGFAAEETKAAFARATELATRGGNFSDRFAAAHGQWTLALTRGELRPARELASAFLREAENRGEVVEAGVARRGLALISTFLGDFAEARAHCERALDACAPQLEEKARERYGEYTGTLVTGLLALTNWRMGEVERAYQLVEAVNRRATELGHAPSMVHPLYTKWYLEVLRGDVSAALRTANAVKALAQEHGMAHWRIIGELFCAWTRGRLHDPAAGAEEFRRALAALADRGHRVDAPFHSALLAEIETEALGAERALARLDEALALAQQIEVREDLAFMHRLRGDILLKRDAANPAPAEEAYRAAIAIAEQQGARSLGLQASLALAKLYHLTDRPAEAYAILAPALEGFSPTPRMPEIAEAQALLERLAHP